MHYNTEQLTESLRAALRVPLSDNSPSGITAVLRDEHPADIADALRSLTRPESLAVFNWLDNERAAQVMPQLEPETSLYLWDNAPPGRIAELLDALPMDDAAHIVAQNAPEHIEAILTDLSSRAPEDAEDVRELLTHAPETAGRLMTDKFVRLSANMTALEALEFVRQVDKQVETVTDLYVVERNGAQEKLIGVLSLRELVRSQSTDIISSVMETDVVTVSVDTDQQEVARLISRYDFLTIPVLDREGTLAGIVTVDDIIDVMVEEFNEDIMRFVGSDAEVMDKRNSTQVALLRLPWLMGTMLIELFAGKVISHFDYVLRDVILLASFMPVISAISGNVGLQAAAIVVRGLDTGHVSLGTWGKVLAKEVGASFLMAMVCGVVLGTVGILWSKHLTFGLVVGAGMTCSMLTASCMGTIIPMLSKRFGFDPATTAGPFETAFQDVIGFGVFLWLASMLLPLLR